MEYPRPSTNLGKSIAINGNVPTSPASESGSSAGLSQTPTLPRTDSDTFSCCHSSSGTMTGTPPATSASETASRSRAQPSSTIARSLMSDGINALLERLDAQSADGIDEALVLVPPLDVDVDQARHDVGHLLRRERRSDDLAQRGLFPLVAADGDLVPLLAVLIHAEHADVADVVMPAGIHAARDIEVDLTDVVQIVEVVEAALYAFRNGDRLGVGERAEVAAGAADDIGEQADVRCREAQRLELAPQCQQLRLLHVGEDQVLLVRDAQFAEAVDVGEIGDHVHLIGRRVARRHAGLF